MVTYIYLKKKDIINMKYEKGILKYGRDKNI